MSNTLYTHPEYKQRAIDWQLCKDLYEGDHDNIVNKYLIPHVIEQGSDKTATRLKQQRQNRTRYKNLSSIGISLLLSLFFRTPPKADKKLEALLEETGGDKDIDGKGTSYQSFIKNKLAFAYLNYGRAFVLADSFPIEPRTLKEQLDLKARPYLDIIEPLEVLDWNIEYQDTKRIGKFNFLRHVFYGIKPRKSSSEEPILCKYSRELAVVNGKYTVKQFYVECDSNFKTKENFTKDGQDSWQQDGDIITTKLEEIPVSYIDGSSWLSDPNQESLRYFNIRSNKDNVLHQQCYQDKYIKGVEPTDIARINAMSEYAYKLLPTDGDAFAIEPVDPIAYEKSEAEAQASFYNVLLNKLRILPSSSDETQAADAIDKENEFTYAMVESALTEIEDVTNSAFKNYALLMGKKDFDGKVEINKQITPESFNQFIAMHSAFRDILGNIEGYDKAVAKKVIKKARFETEEEKDLLKQADSIKTEYVKTDPHAEDPVKKVINGG